MNKKEKTLILLFKECERTKSFTFDNELVKKIARETGFKNPFDTTHIDCIDKLPNIFKDKDYFIAHLGKGKHRFVKGIANGYHIFETIQNEESWSYSPSVINELNTSEANILSIAYNQRILSHFLYDDVSITPKIYNSHRTQYSFKYKIEQELITTHKQQIEIDMTLEYNKHISILEAKNGFQRDFAIYQIYLPFLYYTEMEKERRLGIERINCCYLLREKRLNAMVIKIYQYTFTDPYDMSSIGLVKSAEYTIKKKTS